jgi:hypothetical protein
MRWSAQKYRKLIYLTLPLVCVILIFNGCTRINETTPGPENQPPFKETLSEGDQAILNELMPPGETTISAIQGSDHVSPYENQQVEGVHGIVTAIRADGFYMQSLVPDDDPATSEGIYVQQELIPTVRPGDEVLVSAVVKERVLNGNPANDLMITHLRYPTIEILSRGNPLPAPTIIGQGGRMPPTEVIGSETQGRVFTDSNFDPASAGLDFYESLEGMLVQVNHAVVVGPTNQYKEIVVLPDMGVWAGLRTPRGGIVIQPGDFNPERIIIDDALREMPFVQVGDYSPQPIIGVLDYTFGNYKLQPIEDVSFLSGGLQPSDPLEPPSPGGIRIATYNVEVLSARDADRIAFLADHIVNWMASPDIIALQEVADNDGVEGSLAISADLTYREIIAAISKFGGPLYAYTDIDPLPGQDGGIPDANIRVGFLFRLDRGLSMAESPQGDAQTAVTVSNQNGVSVLSLNPGRIDPANPSFTNSRKPLVVTFLLNGQPLYVINNHFNAKGADHALFGAVQPPVLNSEAQRLRQAQVVHNFVASILAVDPDSRVIVLGDLNDFHFSAAIQVLKSNHLHNLIETLPVAERYNYNYDGNSQVLDHILVSDPLFLTLASLDILHLNSEFDYWRQFSDHDPVAATFVLE